MRNRKKKNEMHILRRHLLIVMNNPSLCSQSFFVVDTPKTLNVILYRLPVMCFKLPSLKAVDEE